MKNNNKISVHFPHAHKVKILCSLLPSLALIKTWSNKTYFSLKFLVNLPCNSNKQVPNTYKEMLRSQVFTLKLRRQERKKADKKKADKKKKKAELLCSLLEFEPRAAVFVIPSLKTTPDPQNYSPLP